MKHIDHVKKEITNITSNIFSNFKTMNYDQIYGFLISYILLNDSEIMVENKNLEKIINKINEDDLKKLDYSLSSLVISQQPKPMNKTGIVALDKLLNNRYISQTNYRKFYNIIMEDLIKLNTSKVFIYDQDMIFWTLPLYYPKIDFYYHSGNQSDYKHLLIFLIKNIFNIGNIHAENFTKNKTLIDSNAIIFPQKKNSRKDQRLDLENFRNLIIKKFNTTKECTVRSSLNTKKSEQYKEFYTGNNSMLEKVINLSSSFTTEEFLALTILSFNKSHSNSEFIFLDNKNSNEKTISYNELIQRNCRFNFAMNQNIKPYLGFKRLSHYCEFLSQPQTDFGSDNPENYKIIEITPALLEGYGYLKRTSLQHTIQKNKKEIIKLQPYDVLLSFKGITGESTIIPDDIDSFREDCSIVPNQSILILRLKDSYNLIKKKYIMISVYIHLNSDQGKDELRNLNNGARTNHLRIKDLQRLLIPECDEVYQHHCMTLFKMNSYYKNRIDQLLSSFSNYRQPIYQILDKVTREIKEVNLIHEDSSIEEYGKKQGKDTKFHDIFYAFSKDNWNLNNNKLVLRIGIEPTFENFESHLYWGICLYDKNNKRINLENKDRETFQKLIVETDSDAESDDQESRFICSNYISGLEIDFCNPLFEKQFQEDSNLLKSITDSVQTEMKLKIKNIDFHLNTNNFLYANFCETGQEFLE